MMKQLIALSFPKRVFSSVCVRKKKERKKDPRTSVNIAATTHVAVLHSCEYNDAPLSSV